MKKLFAFALSLLICFSAVYLTSNQKVHAQKTGVLKIGNWDDYIASNDEGTVTMADDFVTWYNKTYDANISVEYITLGTNENMYNELKIDSKAYDLVCPSDYMIQKMISENMVKEFSPEFLDTTNPENHYARNVSPYISNLFDSYTVGTSKTWNNYTAAYMWGTMGMVYDPEYVSHVDGTSWSTFWNTNYKNKLTIKDSVRDSYIIGVAYIKRDQLAELKAKYEAGTINTAAYNKDINALLNDTSDKTIAEVEAVLSTLKDNLFGFEVDSGKQDMITGKININFAWSGDAVYAMDEAEEEGKELYYSVPEDASNVWFDGWVIPKDSENQTLAEAFINYTSSNENAIENMDYIGYTSAVATEDVFDRMVTLYDLSTTPTAEKPHAVDLDYFFGGVAGITDTTVYTDTLNRQFTAQYPSQDVIDRCAIMSYFDDKTNEKVNAMWETVKGTTFPVWIIIVIAVVIVGAIGFLLFKKLKGSKSKGKFKTVSRG